MTSGMKILEGKVQTVRSLIAFDAKLAELRQAEVRAEQEGKIEEALGFFTARMEVIVAGPGNRLAQTAA